MGDRAYESADLDAAIAAYQSALEKTPWNDRIKGVLAATWAEKAAQARAEGQYKGVSRAEGYLREALALTPEDPALRHNLAIVLVDLSTRQMDPEASAALLAEAQSLSPEVASTRPDVRPDLERRLDLAYELVSRGQLEVGIRRLEGIRADHPESPEVARLLAQALVMMGGELEISRDHAAAAESFGRAVTVYREMGACDGGRCEDADVRLAHHNRIVSWVNADRPDRARVALEEAERAGLRFPDLERALTNP
jgi:tetratricopeptide (TPR) repeat protein